jgi:flagellar basal body rod protein FlgG
MIRGLYSAATALNAVSQNQELVSENLANASVPGYRRHGLIFEVLPPESGTAPTPAGAELRGTRAAGGYTNFDAGPIQYTGSSLDLALSPNVYFVLDGPGGPLYTRNGTFRRSAGGELQSHSGLAVRGVGGRGIVVPPNAAQITVSQDGIVLADNVEVGRLQLAEFRDPSVLERAGTTLFQGPQGPPPQPGTFKVEQGYREGSNVQVVNEMVSMLTGMRYYEAAERALRALGEAVGLNTKPQ